MKLLMQYNNEGILFQLQDSQYTTFPLNHAAKGAVDVESWEQLNCAEQLWYDGLLIYDQNKNQYLLPALSCTQLDEETREGLWLPPQEARLTVFERGNLGSSGYQILWAPLMGKNPVGRVVRHGAIIEFRGHQLMLTEAQYRMVTAIEDAGPLTGIDDRARLHSEISQLAAEAGAQMDSFMARREFMFADVADYRLDSDDPQKIRFRPDLPGLSENIREKLPLQLQPTTRIREGGKQKTVFTSPQAREQYNRIAQLPEITGSDVPSFMDNPLEYLPEEIPFDPEQFSERVKGLKIRRAAATPYVRIDPDPNRPGWFNINSGFSIQPQGDTTPEEAPVAQTEEFKALMHAAAEAGEKYFFYEDQWIKVDPKDVREFEKAEKTVEEQYGKQVSRDQCHYVLDIYDNLDRVEYDEHLLAYKKQAAESVFAYTVPDCFAGTLQPHQQEGYGFLCAHHATNTGVLLADDMGLGKTVQIIAFLSYLYSINALATALLVMPTTLLENWKSELQKFLPVEKKIYIHKGSARYRDSAMIRQYDIVMTSYETLSRDQTMLAAIPWTCVICDEVQRIKNFNTVASNAVKGMNTKCRIAMTGTPVENRLSELWSIGDFAQPGLLDSYQQFYKKYEKPLGQTHGQNDALAEELIEKMSPIFLRRTKEILANRLPGKTERTVDLPMDAQCEARYRGIVEDYQCRKEDEKGLQLATIQKLLMLCSHPRLLSGNGQWTADLLIAESPKLRWTVEKLAEIFAAGEKVILFTKFKKMQAMLRLVILEKFGLDTKIINGEISGNRLGVVEEFSHQPGPGAIILSPRAAGVGLTITAANHVIHYTREWNPAVENQATDRAYRIGQTKPVTVYYPVMCSKEFVTAEQRLDELLRDKRELMKNVIIPANLDIKLEEFENVFSMLK